MAQNVLAPSASTFGNDDPGPGNRTNMFLLYFNESPNSRIANNLLSFSQREGIMVSGYGLPYYSPNTVITNNELVGNALATTPEYDYLFRPFYPASIRLASPQITITGNRISGGGNNAILVSDLAPDCTVSNNTIEGNGVAGVFTSGVGSESTGLAFTRNVVRNNVGAGVLVRNAGVGTSARLSENSIYGNGQVAGRETGQLGIDLLSASDAPYTGTPPFVTLNKAGGVGTGGNNLLNYPVLETIAVSGGNLVLKGFATPGALVEVFVAAPNTVAAPNATGNDFGQGKTWLFTRTEGSAQDADNTTGSYGPGPINGFAQGEDNTNRFSFSIPISSLPPAQQAALADCEIRLTATATIGDMTSEFSGNVRLEPPTALIAGSISADQSVCAGASVAPLTGTAPTGGSGIYAYQWEQSTDNGASWTAIAGATSATYAPGSLTATTLFRRQDASGTCKTTTVATTPVTITVTPGLNPGSISADQTLCGGTPPAGLTSTALASGGSGTYAYQWESSLDNGVTWTAIAGATGPTYVPGPLSATTQFRRVATASGGGTCATVAATPVTITVTPGLNPGSISADQSVCTGASVAPLTGTAPTGGTGTYAYRWESSTDNGASWTAIAGATNPTYAPGPLSATTQFRRRVSSGTGVCAVGATLPVTITVTPGLNPGSISADQTLCAGATPASLTSTAPASGGNGTYAYQWQQSTDNGASWADIAGATGPTYAPGPLSATTQFRRRTSSGTGSCATGSSGGVTLTVAPVLTPTVSLSPPPVQCPGTSLSLTATPTNAGSAPVYRWLVNGTAVAVTGPTFSSSTLANGDQVRVELSPTPGLCSTGGATATVTINLSPTPTPTVSIDAQPAGPVCAGEPLSFRLVRATDAGPTPQYQWQVDGTDVAGATGPTFSSTTLRDGQTVTLRLRATTLCNQAVTVASNGIGTRISPSVRISAGPDKDIEVGQSVTLEGTADGSYPVSWTPATGLSFPSGDQLRPVVAPRVTTTYTLSAGTGGCAATDQVTVRVRPGLRIPNAFTPNGDGLDDTWQIERIEDFPSTTVKVFNRWGNQIFSSEDYGRANEWKGEIGGEPAPVGTYYYIVVTKGPFGRSYSGPLTVLY